jgi:hypothetical protein
MTSLTPQAFVAKWRHVELKERSACQEHFIDLCYLGDHPMPVDLSDDEILAPLLALNLERAKKQQPQLVGGSKWTNPAIG